MSVLKNCFTIDATTEISNWLCLTQGNTGALLSCRCSSHHHKSTYNPKKALLVGGMPVWPWFFLKIPSSVTDNCTEALPRQGVLHTRGKRSTAGCQTCHYYCFPFTTPPKQHREMEREREGRIMSFIRSCVINTVVPHSQLSDLLAAVQS